MVYDIAAKRTATGERWLIEAKGGAYSGADSSNDAWSRTGAAFQMTAEWRFQKDIPGDRFAIGIPSSRWLTYTLVGYCQRWTTSAFQYFR